MLSELPLQVAWIAWAKSSSEYTQCIPYLIAVPSLALISAHDLPGSSLIEPNGAAEIKKEWFLIDCRVNAHNCCMLNSVVSRRENKVNPMLQTELQ